MKKLKTLLAFNYFHYYATSILIALLSYEKKYFLLLYLPFSFLIKRYSSKLKVLVSGIIVFGLLFVVDYFPKRIPENGEFIVVDRKETESFYTYIVRQKGRKYLFYHQNKFAIGDVLEISFLEETFTKERTPGGFNQKKYYSSLKIFYKLNVKEIKFIKNKFTFNKIKYYLLSLFEDYPNPAKLYIYTLIFAHNDFETDFKEALSKVGISHLFALSGLHLSMLIIVLEKVFKKSKYSNFFILLILTIYAVIIGFPLSFKRAFIMYFLMILFKEENITSLDSISIAFILMLINPYVRYNLSFILSFLVSFFIILTGENFLKMSLVAFLISIPFLINFNGGILLIGLPISLLVTYLFPIFIMPLVLLSLIKLIAPLTSYLLESFNLFIKMISEGVFIKIHYLNLFMIAFYVVILVFVLAGKNNQLQFKRSKYLGFFLLFLYFYPYLNPQGYIYFLDVGQGDATFISRPFNKANILIDCNKGTYQFLKTRGEIEIDYLFITHGDKDHSEDLFKILEDFKVHHLYINYYDNTGIEEKLVKYNLLKTASDKFICGDVVIEVLGPNQDYFNDNDNSLVLKIEVDNQSFLFMGDSGFKREKELLSYGVKLNSDYLHVAHHGANNSTSEEFLKAVNPKFAVISSGLNNYNHPHPETIERLTNKQIKILYTKTSQTIIIKKYELRALTNSFVIQKDSFSV